MPIIEFTDDDIPSPEHRVELQDLIDATRECGRGLTRWERDFLESVEQQLHEKGRLTPKQETTLRSVHAKHVG